LKNSFKQWPCIDAFLLGAQFGEIDAGGRIKSKWLESKWFSFKFEGCDNIHHHQSRHLGLEMRKKEEEKNTDSTIFDGAQFLTGKKFFFENLDRKERN
jgi:hypothetical protein